MINVLSEFDGLSCGQVVLSQLGLKFNYFASEIEQKAVQIANKNFPEMINLGDVNNWERWQLPKIDLMLAGSPCQDLSRARKGKGLKGERSKLFWIFLESYKHFKPDYFLLENVRMNKESENIISRELKVEPILLNSAHFSGQNRERLYWTNVPQMDLPEPSIERILDIIEDNPDEKYFYKEDYIFHGWDKPVCATLNINGHDILKRVGNPLFKCQCLTAVCGGNQHKKVFMGGRVRKLTPLEYERLQGLPSNYSDGVSDSARYRMIGNGWEINTIKYLLGNLKEIYKK